MSLTDEQQEACEKAWVAYKGFETLMARQDHEARGFRAGFEVALRWATFRYGGATGVWDKAFNDPTEGL